ncbi:cytidylate kinase-like family protein [bacterium]|nr:MAG: cytidylate kinase-like family protein [bacterium]
MERNEVLLRFLGSQVFEKPETRPEPGERAFVTISRQAGAGGRTMATALLDEFGRRGSPALAGWQWADRDVCESLAADPRLHTSLEALLDEHYRGRLEDYLAQVISGAAPQFKLHQALFATMRSLAAVGKVVLVGRAGVCATRGMPGGVHIRLVGSRGARVERVARRFGWDGTKAERWVDEQDRSRAALVREYFGQNMDDPLLFDAVINTDSVPAAAAAAAVADLVLARLRMPLRS